MSSELERSWDALVDRARRAPAPPAPDIDIAALLAVRAPNRPVGWPRWAAIAALVAANALVAPLWRSAWTQASYGVASLFGPVPPPAVPPAPRLPEPPRVTAPDLGAMLPDFHAIVREKRSP